MNKYKLSVYALFIIWFSIVAWLLFTPVKSMDTNCNEVPLAVSEEFEIMCLGDVNKPAQEIVTYEDWFKENANQIPACKITHYCTEKYEHICGTGAGITSTGVPVTAGWTCAVDPSVIPYGAEVMIDYGGTVEFWKAQDCGGAIKGNHIDLAVSTHELAEDLGVKYATVYWMEVEYEFG